MTLSRADNRSDRKAALGGRLRRQWRRLTVATVSLVLLGIVVAGGIAVSRARLRARPADSERIRDRKR